MNKDKIMALIKSPEAREIAQLQEIEKRITRRERLHHILIAGLSVLLVASLSCHLLHKDKKRFF